MSAFVHYCNDGMNHAPILVIFTACDQRLTYEYVGDGRTGSPDGWTSDWVDVTCRACLDVHDACKRCWMPQLEITSPHSDHYQDTTEPDAKLPEVAEYPLGDL